MLIAVSYEGKEWLVDENIAKRFIEFRKVLEDPELGAKAMAFIAMYADPDSEYRKSFKDEEDTLKQAYSTVYETDKTNAFELRPAVKNAIAQYKKLCDTPEARLTESFEIGMEALEKTIRKMAKQPTKLDEMLDYMGKAGELRKKYYEVTGKKTIKDKAKEIKESVSGRTKSWGEMRRA